MRGIAKLSAAQLGEWWGVSTANACGVLSLLGQAQIPVYEINATSAGSCPGTVAALTDVSFEHVWVKVKINGSWYAFDPSYKPHTFKSGIDLASAATTGYDAASYLSSAQSGATVTADYVQNIHRANIRSKLAGYATTLAGYLRANKPAATLDDVLAYDAEGRLRQTLIAASTTNLLYDATDLIAEYDAAGTTLQRRYVHGPGTDEPIVWYEGAGTTAKNWLYADHLGSIVATANATGASTGIYSYGPYGEPNTTTGPRFRYTGQQLIGELGLYYYKARFYSPSLGRFLQTDPIGYRDDVNLYAYVGNNPGNRIDPTGLASLGAWAYPTASGVSTYPVAPQSNLQGTSLGNLIDNSPINDPPLERFYPEQFLIGGGGLGILRGAAQAVAKGTGAAAARETAAFTEISIGAKATRNSANQLNVGLMQSQTIENLAASGYAKTMSKDGAVTVMTQGDKVYRFYPQSTGGGVLGAPAGVPSASVSILDKIVTKLRFLGE
ncbi:RHS repeat-associated core domain-containing protein [Variovorax sp. WS11]|uniref:RHS repeat-associated core domain-containing protein n=1 Tax=Variovorax sp. WS11 TaxID=1105204 RepID=UPI001EF23444|nr:RHS repeat-associated core domain-containing protein [Variovorax sp. WS11]